MGTDSIERGFLFPQLHTLAVSPVGFVKSRQSLTTMVKERKNSTQVHSINTLIYPRPVGVFDGRDMLYRHELNKLVPNVIQW